MSLIRNNVLFITIDSCRFDTASKATTTNLSKIGRLTKALTSGNYTVPAHHAFFQGHLPNAINSKLPHHSEAVRQLWRVRLYNKNPTGVEAKRSSMILTGSNIFEGYDSLGFHILGVGGVSQFSSEGEGLRKYFKHFLYFGKQMFEEQLSPRDWHQFPLNNVDQIIEQLGGEEKWFLFVNCNETHYPYDFGKGIEQQTLEEMQMLKPILNLREGKVKLENLEIFEKMHQMQVSALEEVDKRIGSLVQALPKNRPILTIICADHGENFGEEFQGAIRWGHMIPSEEVMTVPLIIGEVTSA